MNTEDVNDFIKVFKNMKPLESIRFKKQCKSPLEVPELLKLKIISEMWFGYEWDCEDRKSVV